jgi:biotin transport system ATP-binding protein
LGFLKTIGDNARALAGNRQPAEGSVREGSGGIRFESVGFSRGSRPIFRDLSLTIAERRVGLIGDNGSGKSTLLRLVNGLLQPDSGRVVVDGLDTTRDRKALPSRVGFVFQNADHQLIFPTVAEEVAFGLAEQRGLDARAARERALDLLAQFGCQGWEERAVHELSEGEKQLVCILGVIAPEPAVVLLDEPFASLDLPTRLVLADRLLQLPQQIVAASHDFELLARFDRVVWLDGGKVRADGRPDEVIRAYEAEARRRAADPGARGR